MDDVADPPVLPPAFAPAPEGFVRQPHGGMLRAPWRPGQAGNVHGRSGQYWETLRLAREASPAAMRKLIGKMDSSDERVALLAIQAVIERAWGRPKEVNPNDASPRTTLDLSRLSPAELELLMRIAKSGAIRPADDGDCS
jgi:hypothetical protein